LIATMILSDNDIRERIKSGEMSISPLSDDQIGPASVDLTLSQEWQYFRDGLSAGIVDLSKKGFKESFRTIKAESITLSPGQICLAKTVEKISLPPYIMGKLEGRSRFARMGLIIHLTSALVQPGSSNRQVLEIANLAPFTIRLHAGMRISQVVFEHLETPTSKPYRKHGKIARRQ